MSKQHSHVFSVSGGGEARWSSTCLFQQLSYSGGVASQAGDALVDQDQVADAFAGVLQQAHGADVVLRDIVPAAALAGLLEVDGGGVNQQRHHAGKVLDEVAVKDLLDEALQSGELVVAQQAVQVLVQDELLCCA